MNYISEEDYLTVFDPYCFALLDVCFFVSSHLCYTPGSHMHYSKIAWIVYFI